MAYTAGKFERTAAVHLATAIKAEDDLRYDQRLRTPEEIMREALTRLDIDTDDAMVSRYVRFWVEDGQSVREFIADLRNSLRPARPREGG